MATTNDDVEAGLQSFNRGSLVPSEISRSPGQSAEALTAQQAALWRKKRRSYILIYAAIFCIAYVTSLDANTSYLYLNFACSEFGSLASFSTIAIVQQLCFAIAKPPIAKLSDVFGRAEAYAFSLILYVCGYLFVAKAPSLNQLIGGIGLQSTGTTGLQVLQSIIIADSTTAKWRGLIIGIVNLPYLINFAVAGPLANAVLVNKDWRFGFLLWTFVVPLAASPLLITLFVGQRRAKLAGLMTRNPIKSRWCLPALHELSNEIDAIGLILFSVGFALMLVPMSEFGKGAAITISPQQMLMGSALVIALFLIWEGFAKNPILPYRFLTNLSVVCICIVGVLDFCSFYLSWTFLSSFIQVLKGWDQTRTGYFASTQNVTSTLTGILVGWAMAATRRYKTLLVVGIIVRLVGVAMMVRYRSVGSPTALLVMCQLLQGIGGGSVAITMQVAVQCVVRHSDVAIVTAIELLMTECGAAIGSALAGLVYSSDLPNALASRLPNMSKDEIYLIAGSLPAALSYPMGTDTREAIIEAWVQIMHKLCIMAALILVPAIFFGLAIPDGELPDVLHHHHHHHSRSISGSHPQGSEHRSQRSTSGSLQTNTAHHRRGLGRTTKSMGSLRSGNSVRRAPSRSRISSTLLPDQDEAIESPTESLNSSRVQEQVGSAMIRGRSSGEIGRSLRFVTDPRLKSDRDRRSKESDPLLGDTDQD